MVALLSQSGCSQTECKPKVITETKYIEHKIPSELLKDKPLPKVPQATKDSEVATYIAELFFYSQEAKQTIKKISKFNDINISKDLK